MRLRSILRRLRRGAAKLGVRAEKLGVGSIRRPARLTRRRVVAGAAALAVPLLWAFTGQRRDPSHRRK